MVRVTEIAINEITKKATVSLFADEKTDVIADMDIIGFPDNLEIEAGSDVMTAAGDIAFMKSDGTWNWV